MNRIISRSLRREGFNGKLNVSSYYHSSFTILATICRIFNLILILILAFEFLILKFSTGNGYKK